MSEDDASTLPSYGSRGRPAPTPTAREVAFNENANGGVLAHAEGALPSVDAGGGIEAQFRISVEQTMADRGWPVEDVQKRKEAARIVLDEYQRLPADLRYGDGDSLASQVTDAVYSTVVYGTATAAGRPASDQKERGVTQATESTRGFAQMSESTPKRTNAPLYGGRAVAADSYGGQRNYARLLVLASDHGLRLSRTDDRRRAEKLLLAELGDDAPIALSENGTAPKPAMYGSRAARAVNDGGRGIALQATANAELRRLSEDDPLRVSKAWRKAVTDTPALAPSYGWGRRG